MIYGSQDSAVTFPGIQISSNGDEGKFGGARAVRSQDKSSHSLTPLNQSTSSLRKSWSAKGSSSKFTVKLSKRSKGTIFMLGTSGPVLVFEKKN